MVSRWAREPTPFPQCFPDKGMNATVYTMKDKSKKENGDMALQPILFTKGQYKELLRAISAYALVKQSATVPYIDPTGLGDYVMEQGRKFGFDKVKMNQKDWFEEVNDEVFESLFQYTQEEMWHHLAHILAQRDVRKEIEDKTELSEKELPSDMFLDAMAGKVNLYLEEFEKNGINNVTVKYKGGHISNIQIEGE